MPYQEKISVVDPPIHPSTLSTSTISLDQQKQARRGLLFYFGLLLPLTALFDGLLLFTQQITILFLLNVFLVMWTPTIASIATRLILHENSGDISFRWHGTATLKACGIAVISPALVGLVSYGIAWLLGLTPFEPFHPTGGLAEFIALPLFGPPSLTGQIGLAILYLIPIAIISATGEEIGWRGYMLTRLVDSKLPYPILISGVIWGLWHWPQILMSAPVAGQPQIVTASIFLITIIGLGYICAYVRLKTGSIWPSILAHAAWNAIIVEIFNAFTRGLDTSFWVGEPGLITALTMVVVAFIFGRLIKKNTLQCL